VEISNVREFRISNEKTPKQTIKLKELTSSYFN